MQRPLRPRLGRALLLTSALTLAIPSLLPEVARASVADQQREVERIVDELERLEEQADILAEDHVEAIDQKNQLDEEVAAAERRVAAKEGELATLRGDLSEVAARSFAGAGADVLGPLFSSAASYSDGLRRDQYSRVALSVGTVTTDDLDELIADLDQERQDLDAKRQQVEQLAQTIAQKQQQTEQLRDQYLQRRAEAEARLGELIAAEERARAEAAYQKLQAELAAQQAASSGGGGGGGGGNSSGGGAGGGGSGGGSGGGGGGGGTSSPPKPPPPSNVPPVSGLAGIAISAARGQIGVPYRYATSSPGVSFDCSGLTLYAWGKAGVYLPHNSRAQAASLPRVPAAAAQPGDLIFFYSPISHVGIYTGGGMMVHAPNTGSYVKESGVSWGKVTAVGRPG